MAEDTPLEKNVWGQDRPAQPCSQCGYFAPAQASREAGGETTVPTCATCRHARPVRPDVPDRSAYRMRLWCAAMMPDQSGENRGLTAPTFDRRVPDDYGCTLHEPAADRQPQKAPLACEDCGGHYAAFPLDLTLPDEQWERIMPGRHGGGILCARCIVARAADLQGAVAVRARIEFASSPRPLAELPHVEATERGIDDE